MYDTVLKKIAAYDNIVIHRHKNPDLDAFGAQLGLRGIILNNFSGKDVKVVGDENDLSFMGKMDYVDDDFYKDALVIVVDVAVRALVSDDRYRLAKETMVIDHHLNKTDFADTFISDSSHVATCQLLTHMVMVKQLSIDSETATQLIAGLIADSGRFLYPQTDALTFKAAAYLIEHGARIQDIYDTLYIEDLRFKKLKGHFINNFKTTQNRVAYMKNEHALVEQFKVPSFTISRGMVNQMSGIKGIPIWANFTEDEQGDIVCELRSKSIPIVDVAKKYGGGGHSLACGCTVSTWEDTDKILADLDALAERMVFNG